MRSLSTSRRVIESLSTLKQREERLFKQASKLQSRRRVNGKKSRRDVSKNNKASAREACAELQTINHAAQSFDTHIYKITDAFI